MGEQNSFVCMCVRKGFTKASLKVQAESGERDFTAVIQQAMRPKFKNINTVVFHSHADKNLT